MWKIVFGLFVVLTFAEERLGVCATKFGHEPGAYNVPNLIPYESSEMTYKPTGQMLPNRWYSAALNTAVVNDSAVCYSGDTCLKTINRKENWRNLFYRVPYDMLESGFHYMFNVFIKLTNSSHDLIKISTLSRSWYKDPSDHNGNKVTYKFFTASHYKVEDKWLLFSVEFLVSQQDKADFSYLDFYLKVSDSTDFILDAASLTKIDYADWKTEANNNIASTRMGSIQLNVSVSSNLDLSKVSVKVEQTRRLFPFGVAVNAAVIGGNDSEPFVQRYRAWVESRVTWAVFLLATKWRPMEPDHRDDTDKKFEIADKALDWLDSKNIKTRGHAVHWNSRSRVPSWVLNQPNKTAEIERRTNYVVEHYKGRLQHWDVCNEFTISRQYQDWLGREDVLEYLFREVRRIDPDVKLFTNEWGNLQKNYHFAETVNAILRLKKQGLIDAIGLQSHFKAKNNELNMELIKRRLEIFTSLGLPVWITELTVTASDPVVRGDLLADCLTLFYGTPGVHGIVLWDFAPKATNNEMLPCALASPDVVNNAAGDKYDETLASWTTNLTLGPSDTSIKAFYGNYNITLLYDGIVQRKLTNVTLTPDNDVITVNCSLDMSSSLTLT